MDRMTEYKQKHQYLLIILLFIFTLNGRAQAPIDLWDKKIKVDTLKTIPPLNVNNFRIDTILSNKSYREHFKVVPSRINIYDLPYSLTANFPNYKRLAINTGALYAAGFLTIGVLYLLPENTTAWNKEHMMKIPPFKRWWQNVKKGPVVDKDNFVFNYILHPYGGAAYFMSARSQGFNFFYSFLYGAGVSTIFWEYGIEAFMEIPSIQDLIITPVMGALIGEGFYKLKRNIVANGYRLFGSRFLGYLVAYLIDPVNEVVGLFAGNPNRPKSKSKDLSIGCAPWLSPTTNGTTLGFTVGISF